MVYVEGPRELQSEGETAPSFIELADKAVDSLKARRQQCLSIVCGPITTGGTGNQVHNFEIFNAAIRGLERRGVGIFNQVPYEFGLRRLALEWEARGNTGYCLPILEVFYARLFESGFITQGWFIPGWQSSFGARWEREKLSSRGCIIHDFTWGELKAFLDHDYPARHVEHIMKLLKAA